MNLATKEAEGERREHELEKKGMGTRQYAFGDAWFHLIGLPPPPLRHLVESQITAPMISIVTAISRLCESCGQ